MCVCVYLGEFYVGLTDVPNRVFVSVCFLPPVYSTKFNYERSYSVHLMPLRTRAPRN